MEKLLKIVDGPMKGAEIALVPGTRVKVGSGDGCDIVVADSSLAETAFELDVAANAVTLVLPDGTTSELADFEIRTFGSTALAVGPATGAWGELWQRRADEAAPAEEAEKPAPDAAPAPAAPAAQETVATGRRGHRIVTGRRGHRIVTALLVLLLLVLVLAAAAYFGWRYRDTLRGFVEARRAPAAETPVAPPPPTLAEIASAHGLKLEDRDGLPHLVGNLARRTERLAIRALALASDRRVRFDLTDDQTLLAGAKDTFYVTTGGSLQALAVSNRVVTVAGSVANAATLARVLRTLGEDVPKIASCDTAAVRFAETALPAEAAPAAPAPAAEPANPIKAEVLQAPVERKAVRVPMPPVAGILTAPYPCVVLEKGDRILEGAQVGALTLKRISEEELVFEGPAGEVTWRP